MNFKYKTLMFVTLFVFCIGSVCATDPNDNKNPDSKVNYNGNFVKVEDLEKIANEIIQNSCKLKVDNEKLNETVTNQSIEINKLKEDNTRLNSKIQDLEDSNKQKDIRIQNLEKSNIKIEESNKRLEESNKYFKEELNEYKIRIQNLEDSNKQKDIRIQNLEDRLDKKDLEIQKLHDEKDKLNDEIKQAYRKIEQTNNEKFNILKEYLNSPKKEDLEQLNKKIDDKDNQINELKAKIEILNNIISVSREDVYNSLKNLSSVEKIQCGKYIFNQEDYLKIPLIKEGKKRIMEYKNKHGKLPNYVTIAGYELPQEIYKELYNM